MNSARLAFLTGLFATWLALDAGREQPNADDRRLGRAAAEAALPFFEPQRALF